MTWTSLLLLLLAACRPLIAQGTGAATMDLYLRSGGKPTAARVYLIDESGKAHLAAEAVTYSRRGEDHSVIDQSAVIPLPPGKYRVRAEKGAEFRPAEKAVELTAGEPVRVDLDIPRFYNMNEQGWYSGDLHIHRDPEEMPLLVRAEELNIGPAITRHLGGSRPPSAAYPTVPFVQVPGGYFVSGQNQEVERLGKGHGAVVLLNTPQPADANMTALYPMEADFCRHARAQAGFVDAEKPFWKNVPVNIALGLVHAVGIVNNHFHPRAMLLDTEKWGSMERDRPVYKTPAGFAQWMMDLYYSYLNCGFRLPVSAGSASGVMPSWPGYERVYVHLSAPFSYDQWFADLKTGRSIATNGPLMVVYLDGLPPGAEAFSEGPAAHTIAIEAHSQDKLDRVEIVFNGEVIRTFPGGGNAVFRTAVNLTVSEPGWMAVRAFEPAGETIRYAHSSPFYFTRNGKLPVKRAAALRWADYVRGLAASLDPAEYPSPADHEKAQRTFHEAESVYRRLAQ